MASLSLKYRIAIVAFLLQLGMFSHLLWQTFSVTRDAELLKTETRETVFLNLLTRMSRPALLTAEYSDFQLLITSLATDPHVSRIMLMDQHGLIVASTDMREIGTSRPHMRIFKDAVWRSQEISNEAERMGILAVRYSRADVSKAQVAMLRRGIPIAAGGIIVSALVALGLGVILTRRLSALERATQNMGRGEACVTVPVTGQDEIARLSRLFNEMSVNLDAQFTKLRQSATVFECTSEVVIITDLRGITLSVNRAFTRVLGYEADEIVGKNASLLKSGRHTKEFFEDMWHKIINTGTWQGEIWNRRKNGDIFPAWLTIKAVTVADGIPTHYVGVFSDMSVIRRSEAELEHLTHHDPLTGLPNRLLFDARCGHALELARREQWKAALLYLDLDRFKNINDSYGHQMGDCVLRTIAERLDKVLEGEYTLARLGGDEFCVLIEQLEQDQYAATVATTIQHAISQPLHCDGHEFFLTASIGISIFPQDGDDHATLLRNSDTAMYRAKEATRGAFQFYSREHTSRIRERVSMEASLRRAINRGEVLLHYQPQISLLTGEILGVEALARWDSPEFGPVPPSKFIPIAEESGQILELGEWILDEACRQVQGWIDMKLGVQRLAVNLSVLQIQRLDIVRLVRRILDTTRLAPQLLELEITEGYIMHQTDHAIKVLRQLRDLGVTIAIDDFGTGFSSLSYLHRLPIDRLKIDRSFVSEIGRGSRSAQVAQAIISLGKLLDLAIIAEGIELPEQAATLLKWGCTEGQGFLYSRAIPPAELELFCRNSGRVIQ